MPAKERRSSNNRSISSLVAGSITFWSRFKGKLPTTFVTFKFLFSPVNMTVFHGSGRRTNGTIRPSWQKTYRGYYLTIITSWPLPERQVQRRQRLLTADSTFMKDTRLSIYPRRRDTGPGPCPYFINLEYAVYRIQIQQLPTCGIVKRAIEPKILTKALPPL